MQKHSEIVTDILAGGQTATCTQKCVALAELDDCDFPHLSIDVLSRSGSFKTIFEMPLMIGEVLDGLHLPVLLRVSMNGQPVAGVRGETGGKSPDGNS